MDSLDDASHSFWLLCRSRRAVSEVQALPQAASFRLTVAECLTIPPMDRGTVLAGGAGLSRRLRWVHVVDHNDVEGALIGGELVLTSGVTLGHDHGLQRAIFPMMQRLEIAALVIALGPYMERVPQQMLDAAERHGIPIVALPWDVNFRDVTHALLTRLVQSHYAFLESAERLNRDLLNIVMRRGGLGAVCARLGAQVGRGTAIADPAFQLLARHEASAAVSRAAGLLAGGALSAAAISAVPTLHGPVLRTQELRGPGGHVLGTATPILAASRLIGWLLVESASGNPPSPFDTLVAEAAAMVAGLLMAQTEEVTRASQRRSEDLLLDTLYGTVALTAEAAAELGLDADAVCLVVLAVIEGGPADAAPSIASVLMTRQGLTGRLAQRGSQLVGVVQGARLAEFGVALGRALQRADMVPRVALSRTLPQASMMQLGYREATETLRLARVMFPDRVVVNGEETAALGLFLRGAAAAATPGAAFPAITRLRRGERGASAGGPGALVETLGCFLEHDGNISAAARALGIHRHTLLYRLERIGERLGHALDGPTRLELRLQLLAWRLAGQP